MYIIVGSNKKQNVKQGPQTPGATKQWRQIQCTVIKWYNVHIFVKK